MQISLESMAIELPHVDGHPNRLPFRGVLTLVDVPSDKPPAGARGHRVLLTRTAAERALPSLLGMALDFTPNLDGHDARRKVGVITSADIVPVRDTSPGGDARRYMSVGCALEIAGYIFARDFPEIVELMRGREGAEPTLRQNRPTTPASQNRDCWGPRAKDGAPEKLGMSYEIANARVADVNAQVWVLTDVTFTGAAMLLRSKAAYGSTWIDLGEQEAADGNKPPSLECHAEAAAAAEASREC